jgi:hypothetical protein
VDAGGEVGVFFGKNSGSLLGPQNRSKHGRVFSSSFRKKGIFIEVILIELGRLEEDCEDLESIITTPVISIQPVCHLNSPGHG